jgi:hypothetical protein
LRQPGYGAWARYKTAKGAELCSWLGTFPLNGSEEFTRYSEQALLKATCNLEQHVPGDPQPIQS